MDDAASKALLTIFLTLPKCTGEDLKGREKVTQVEKVVLIVI